MHIKALNPICSLPRERVIRVLLTKVNLNGEG